MQQRSPVHTYRPSRVSVTPGYIALTFERVRVRATSHSHESAQSLSACGLVSTLPRTRQARGLLRDREACCWACWNVLEVHPTPKTRSWSVGVGTRFPSSIIAGLALEKLLKSNVTKIPIAHRHPFSPWYYFSGIGRMQQDRHDSRDMDPGGFPRAASNDQPTDNYFTRRKNC